MYIGVKKRYISLLFSLSVGVPFYILFLFDKFDITMCKFKMYSMLLWYIYIL